MSMARWRPFGVRLDWRVWLIYTHRWLGIAGCLLFLAWFVSGIVMMYARMPAVTAEERLLHAAPIAFAAVRLSPSEAIARAAEASAASADAGAAARGTAARGPDGRGAAGGGDAGRAAVRGGRGGRGDVLPAVQLAMYDGRPIYRLGGGERGGAPQAIFADTGDRLPGADAAQALAIARRWAPAHAGTLTYDARLTIADQWTLQARQHLPLHRIALHDADDSRLYVSSRTGEVVMETARRERFWAYWGPVMHWLYLPVLRRNGPLWTQVIIWSSAIGCVMCVAGLVLGLWRYSPSARFRLRRTASHTPYAGLMKWHHYAGLIFGLVTFTWTFSGLLSMGPWDWQSNGAPTPAQRRAISGAAGAGAGDAAGTRAGAPPAAAASAPARASGAANGVGASDGDRGGDDRGRDNGAGAKGVSPLEAITVDRVREAGAAMARTFAPVEMTLTQFRGEPYWQSDAPPRAEDVAPDGQPRDGAAPRAHRLVRADRPDLGAFARFDAPTMEAVAREAMPGEPVIDAVWLEAYDAYYYDRRGARALPVLRVRYADAARTWLYLDPHRGTIALLSRPGGRANRWLYHGLHSLDLPFLYTRRPLWDIVVIVLSLGGIALGVTTLLPAWRRVKGHVSRLARRVAHAAFPARRRAPSATRGVDHHATH